MASDTKDMSRDVLEAEVNTLRSSIDFVMERVNDVVTENKGLKEELEALHKTLKIYSSEAATMIGRVIKLNEKIAKYQALHISLRKLLETPITE